MRVCASCARLLASEHCPEDGGQAVEVDRLGDGARIGSYTVMGMVGKGGMGHVYEAVHGELGRRVAIKFLRDDIEDDELPERFLREARAVSRIDHDNVIRITDYGDGSDGAVFFVMEYLAGETLWDLNYRHPGGLELPVILDIFTQIMRALEAAHRSGVVHRDLKPTNVMIVERESTPHFVKLVDFGLARLLDKHSQGPGLTIEGTIMGTPEYMSPEQVDGKRAGVESDVYSLGVMLYEAVTGDVPFPAAGVSFLPLARKILDEIPVAPGQRREIPAALDHLIMRALSKDPEDRYPSVALMRSELEDALAHVDAAERFDAAQTEPSLSNLERPRRVVDPTPPPGPARTTAAAAPRRSAWPAIAAVGLIAAVVAATVGIAVTAAGDGDAGVDAAALTPDAAPPSIAGLWVQGSEREAIELARASLEREIAAGEVAAIRGLLAAATPATARLLFAALESGPELRGETAAAIADLELFDGARRIQAAIARSGPALRIELTAALHRLNGSGKPALLEAIGGADRNAALAAAEALAPGGDREALRALREVLASEPPGRTRWLRAATALARTGDRAAIRQLERLRASADERAAVAGAEALALRGDEAAAGYLDRVVGDARFSARREAASALARLGRTSALEFVKPALGGSDLDKLAAIAVAARLARRGGDAHGAAIAALAESANLEVSAAARAALLAF